MPIQQICTVIRMTQLNPTTWWMALNAGKLVEEHGLRPSQFLHIKCGDGQLLRRPVSVSETVTSQAEQEDIVSIIFEVRGEGTKWLSQRKLGDKLDVLGPLGNGFDFNESGRYLLVGGGIGIPPLIGCADGLCEHSTAVLGYRSKDKAVPWVIDRFRERCQEAIVCTDDGSLGRHGFVDSQVREILAKDNSFTAILACGPKPMLKSVARMAAVFGVPCQVSMEERMACGIGACLGCAIRMKNGTMRHVCKDGPVFKAEEVDWDA